MTTPPMTTTAPPLLFTKRTSSMSSSHQMGTNWWERVVVQRSAYAVDALVERLTDRSSFIREVAPPMTASTSLAVLNREEVLAGSVLGRGTYSDVYEVDGLELCYEEGDDYEPGFGDEEEEEHIVSTAKAARENLQSKVKLGRRYAIKHLKPDLLKDSKLFVSAAADLIMEAKFLSRLCHPNILSLRGVAMGGTAAYACTGLYDSFFIIVDRLHQTLNEKLKEWRLETTTHLCKSNTKESTIIKLGIAYQLGSALAYLHERRLVYRDLKPHNVGLSSEGQVLLFDFGFVRQLPQSGPCMMDNNVNMPSNTTAAAGDDTTDTPTDDGNETTPSDEPRSDEDEMMLYGMSGKGTLMYMSPEVLGRRRYNQKTDVYGWSIILYEMMTLRRPYTIESVSSHRQTIYHKGERPPLEKSGIPQPIQHLMANCWDGNVARRYNMEEAILHLEYIHSHVTEPEFQYSQAADGGIGIDMCLSAATNTLWSSVGTLWNTVVKEIQVGCSHFQQKPQTEDPLKLDSPSPRQAEQPIISPATTATKSSSSDFDDISSLSARGGEVSYAFDDEDETNQHEALDEAECRTPAEVIVGRNTSTVLPAAQSQGIRTTNSEETLIATNNNDCPRIERQAVLPAAQSQGIRTTNSDETLIATNSNDCPRIERQAPRGHHGTLLYHAYYGRVSLSGGNKKAVASDGLYKDRLLRTIHSAQGTEPSPKTPIPPNQVVSPSA